MIRIKNAGASAYYSRLENYVYNILLSLARTMKSSLEPDASIGAGGGYCYRFSNPGAAHPLPVPAST